MKPSGKALRCAVYTRVSTEHGLEQEFNSLDNQREAAEAYVKSQAHEGWRCLPGRFDDGGYSGGSTERPALQALLGEIRAGRVDVVVVYKVDRLTRSLADFAKLVELFDAHGVSFVSVTQAFNTTSSMGRLTLNVLLSFAQFEREVTSERIRDKIGASKRRGLWVGGMVPLGYASRDKKLVVVDEEADRVRLIFGRYLELGSLNRLLHDLRARGVVTKVRGLSGGRTMGGLPFTRGPLAYLLRNRFYIGEITFKGAVYPADHPAILDRALFDAVQAKLSDQRASSSTERSASGAPLMGRLYDEAGHRMTPSHATKAGVRYRYYVSSALNQGRAQEAGSVTRIAAPEIERIVLQAVREHDPANADLGERELINARVDRIIVRSDAIEIRLAEQAEGVDAPTIRLPWSRSSQSRHREIIVPTGPASPQRPIRSETRSTLVAAIARGRMWLDEIVAGRTTGADEIAARAGCSARQVNATISLAFLAPDLVKAAIDGRLPRGIGVTQMTDLPSEWSRQTTMLGIRPSGAGR